MGTEARKRVVIWLKCPACGYDNYAVEVFEVYEIETCPKCGHRDTFERFRREQ